jgi:hypothetical protein
MFSDEEIAEILISMVEGGDFPDRSVTEKHIRAIEDFERVSNDKVQFIIEHHPHIFGLRSKGKPSSAYTTEHHLYELISDN